MVLTIIIDISACFVNAVHKSKAAVSKLQLCSVQNLGIIQRLNSKNVKHSGYSHLNTDPKYPNKVAPRASLKLTITFFRYVIA